MDRRFCTDVPQVCNLLMPCRLATFARLWRKRQAIQEATKQQDDHRHRVRPLAPLPDDTDVWVNVQGRNVPGRVNSTPRSYIIDTPSSQVRQNRSWINRRLPKTVPSQVSIQSNESRPTTHSQTGTVIRPPDQLTYVFLIRKGDVTDVTYTDIIHIVYYTICNLAINICIYLGCLTSLYLYVIHAYYIHCVFVACINQSVWVANILQLKNLYYKLRHLQYNLLVWSSTVLIVNTKSYG